VGRHESEGNPIDDWPQQIRDRLNVYNLYPRIEESELGPDVSMWYFDRHSSQEYLIARAHKVVVQVEVEKPFPDLTSGAPGVGINTFVTAFYYVNEFVLDDKYEMGERAKNLSREKRTLAKAFVYTEFNAILEGNRYNLGVKFWEYYKNHIEL